MRFWDSSAIVPLLLEQPLSGHAVELLSVDTEIVVWWGTQVECWSALCRIQRHDELAAGYVDEGMDRLRALSNSWYEIGPIEEVRLQARRLLRTHALRAADSIQLGAAIVWAGTPEDCELITFDSRLKNAARVEGFLT
jgi:uncharacterized protein